MHEVLEDPGYQTLEWVNEVRVDLALPTLTELPQPTGHLASQTRVGLAIKASVFRLREPNTRPVAIVHDEEKLEILQLRGCTQTLFTYPAFTGGPMIYEVYIPVFTWAYVYGIPVGERVQCQPLPTEVAAA